MYLEEYRDISSPEQIVSMEKYEDRLEITTDLPFYRSVVGYTIGNRPGSASLASRTYAAHLRRAAL